jgi:hypothetical protein
VTVKPPFLYLLNFDFTSNKTISVFRTVNDHLEARWTLTRRGCAQRRALPDHLLSSRTLRHRHSLAAEQARRRAEIARYYSDGVLALQISFMEGALRKCCDLLFLQQAGRDTRAEGARRVCDEAQACGWSRRSLSALRLTICSTSLEVLCMFRRTWKKCCTMIMTNVMFWCILLRIIYRTFTLRNRCIIRNF